MEENKTNKEKSEKFSVLLTDEEQQAQKEQEENQKQETQKRLKKWGIFALMGLVFIGCMYLLFFDNDTSENTEQDNIQEMIPEPTDIALPEDKSKVYEEALISEKQQEKRNYLQSLNYWDENEEEDILSEEDNNNAVQSSVDSYQNIHQNLGNLYEDDSDYEREQMQQEIEDLREQLTQKEQQDPLDTQMKLMERSYQLANQYSPQQSGVPDGEPELVPTDTKADKAYISEKDATFEPVYSVDNRVVSQLPRAISDSLLLENWLKQNQQGFHNMQSQKKQMPMLKNSIKACIHTEQLIDKNNRVPLRLLEPIRVAGMVLPKGTLLTASAKIGEGRLLLDINSLEYQGRIVPISVTAYDLDGQRGLYIPYTPGANAFREIAAGLSQSSGTNYNFSSSAKDQIISEVGKGVLQGTSSYISKKIAHPKIKVKAGYQILLVSKS